MSNPELRPDIFGIETEYSALICFPDSVTQEIVGSCHSKDVSIDLYHEPEGRSSSKIKQEVLDSSLHEIGIIVGPNQGMLSNGGRLYRDPSGFEYCTPETTSAEEAVNRTFDGDEIMLKALSNLRENGIIENFQLNRRIVDHNRTSRGIHLNITTSLESEPASKDVEMLAALNVAKGAIFGSGGLLINKSGDSEYHHSPRLSITSHLASASWEDRPLLRIPFKKDGDLRRVETTSGDALNFAWPMRASLIATNSLFRMLERGVSDLPILKSPVYAAHIVGKHGYEETIEVIREGEVSIVYPQELIQEICIRALEYHNQVPILSDEALQVLPEIIYVSELLSAEPDKADTVVESIARKKAINKLLEKHAEKGRNITLNSEEVCRRDYYWDKLAGGLAERLRKDKDIGWMGFKKDRSIAEDKKRTVTPPQDTRARKRANLIEKGFGGLINDWGNMASIKDPNMYEDIHPLDNGVE
ncbi:proteasome accessory factor PafA2 family protein [Candidatus Saccharibacteria bacterium]|nr:proteasome accessory factor PafA2 family protein [Candidatus Saccharibacteria bacterium]